jgi:hypothetical protein
MHYWHRWLQASALVAFLVVAMVGQGNITLQAKAAGTPAVVEQPTPPFSTLKATEVKQNYVGYHPKAHKTLWIKTNKTVETGYGWEGDFTAIRPIVRDFNKNYFGFVKEGKIVQRPSVDELQDGLALMNLTPFEQEGQFQLYPFGGLAQRQTIKEYTTFTVNPSVFKFVGQAGIRALYTQRAGRDVLDGGLGFFQEAGHKANNPQAGGWYEGATYAQHTLSHAMVTANLMRLYEANPAWVEQRVSLNYPNSEDTVVGVPDILHETRIGIQWLLTMQDAKTGAFHTGISTKQAPTNTSAKPYYDNQPRTLMEPSQLATASAVATLAQAARVYQNFDPDLALDALMAAKKGWDALEKKRVQPLNITLPWAGEMVMYGSSVQPYYRESYWYQNVSSVSPYLVWASLELGKTTNNQALLGYSNKLWQELGVENATLSWQSPLWQLWANPSNSAVVPEATRKAYLELAEKTLPWVRVLQTPFVSPYSFTEYPILPSTNDAWVRHATLWMMAYNETNNTEYLKAALDVYNYISGFNKWDVVMLSGSEASGANIPLQQNPCNQVARSASVGLPGFLLKGVTPQLPTNLPFQDNSNLCQWSATHITWQGHLADLMFRLDTHYNPNFMKPLNADDETVKKLKKYNEFEEDELKRIRKIKEERAKAGGETLPEAPSLPQPEQGEAVAPEAKTGLFNRGMFKRKPAPTPDVSFPSKG